MHFIRVHGRVVPIRESGDASNYKAKEVRRAAVQGALAGSTVPHLIKFATARTMTDIAKISVPGKVVAGAAAIGAGIYARAAKGKENMGRAKAHAELSKKDRAEYDARSNKATKAAGVAGAGLGAVIIGGKEALVNGLRAMKSGAPSPKSFRNLPGGMKAGIGVAAAGYATILGSAIYQGVQNHKMAKIQKPSIGEQGHQALKANLAFTAGALGVLGAHQLPIMASRSSKVQSFARGAVERLKAGRARRVFARPQLLGKGNV